MAASTTHTVVTSWTTDAGDHWVIVTGGHGPLRCDEPIPEGTAVLIDGGRAVKP